MLPVPVVNRNWLAGLIWRMSFVAQGMATPWSPLRLM